MRARSLPPIMTTFSLSSDSASAATTPRAVYTPHAADTPRSTAVDTPRSTSASSSNDTSVSRHRPFRRPPRISPPESEEHDECFSSIVQRITSQTRTNIIRSLVNPVAIIFREGIDPDETAIVFERLENRFFHPDSGDDSQFQIVIDQSCTVCPIITIYIIPERYLPKLVDELSTQNLSLICGAPIIMRERRIDTYDPSAQIEKELGLAIQKRLYLIDRAHCNENPIPSFLGLGMHSRVRHPPSKTAPPSSRLGRIRTRRSSRAVKISRE